MGERSHDQRKKGREAYVERIPSRCKRDGEPGGHVCGGRGKRLQRTWQGFVAGVAPSCGGRQKTLALLADCYSLDVAITRQRYKKKS